MITDVIPFGEALLETEDLDPIYCALVRTEDLDRRTLNRWLLAYWCFYDAGVASFIAESNSPESFWTWMFEAARNEEETPIGTRWKRGAERRHFRGKLALASVEDLHARYKSFPEQMAEVCASRSFSGSLRPAPAPVRKVFSNVKQHVGFGGWIAFKIADMVERVMRCPVDFDEGSVFMFKDPKIGAAMVRERYGVPDAVAYLQKALGGRSAPPLHDRPVGIQEIETVLCKWKSHANGRYYVGKDTKEIRESVRPWIRVSPLARRFAEALPS
jgi:hypothetical protein